MVTQKHTTLTHTIQPQNGFIRRCFPQLQFEIGEPEADLLLQLDHWITFQGKYGWINAPIKTIQKIAFPAWSREKVRRTGLSLTIKHLIIIHQPLPNAGWFIALNPPGITNLKSVRFECRFSKPIHTLPQYVQHIQAQKVTQNVSPPTQNVSPLTQNVSPLTQNVSPLPYIYKESFKESFKEGEDLPPNFDLLAMTIANITHLDFELNLPNIILTTIDLTHAGYTLEDLIDFGWWWTHHDWRWTKNQSPPHLNQIRETIKEALNHEDISKRRALRAQNLDPDDPTTARYRYITGDYADQIQT